MKCSQCERERSGHSSLCQRCRYKRHKKHQDEYRARPEVQAKMKAWRLKYNARPWTKARIRWYKQRVKSWRTILAKRIGQSLLNALHAKKHRKPWRGLLGYSIVDLKRHLERQFAPGMTWENMGAWHLDHIVPIKAFHFSGPTDPAIAVCWGLANLRPVWATINQRKHARREFLL